MSLVTVKDKFQVAIAAGLRRRMGVKVGDLLEATVHQDAIPLRPKAVVDREVVAGELERVLRKAAVAPKDAGRAEEAILEDAIADVAEARNRRR